MNELIKDALKGFPDTMTRKEVIEHCERYVITEPKIWIKALTFAGHVMRHPDCSYSKHTRTFTNYVVKDLKGKIRIT